MNLLRFNGEINVELETKKRVILYNNSFFLETYIYWNGLQNVKWESTSRKIWTNLSKNASVVMDIGANTGIYSVLAKAYNNNCKVYAFEPQPNIYNVLLKNNHLNNFDIICENIALSNITGKLDFYNYGNDAFTAENTTAGSLNKDWRPINQKSIKVDCFRLDEYIASNDIKNIDLIKIDVETFEFEVLAGYGNYLVEHNAIIILEIQNKEIGVNVSNLFNLNEYSFFSIDEDKGFLLPCFLGESDHLKNYLICPNSKLHMLDFIIEKQKSIVV